MKLFSSKNSVHELEHNNCQVKSSKISVDFFDLELPIVLNLNYTLIHCYKKSESTFRSVDVAETAVQLRF